MVSIGTEYRGIKGTYKTSKHIATAGMGHVYEAQASNGHTVIIKFPVSVTPQGDPMDPTLYNLIVEKLKIEAQALKNFTASNAPCIVKYVDESSNPNSFFLVIEKIIGNTLSKTIPAVGLPENKIISMSLDVLQGLDFIHRHNSIYRDMKPDNIMVQKNGRCIMIDFGGIKQGLTQVALNNMNNSTGILTEGWSCPHQSRNNISAECDLYAFGRVMFYMGTNIKPVRFQDQLLKMTKTMHDIKPNISHGLSNLVNQALDPEHNTIHTASEMITELKRLAPNVKIQQPKRLPVNHQSQQITPKHFQQASHAPRIVLLGVEYIISNLVGGSLIGKKHDVVACQKSNGGCNNYNQGRNVFVGWDCPTGCRCSSNPGHMIDRHHMRVWRDHNRDICVINNDPDRRSAINRNNRWIPMQYNKKEILKDHDQVAMLYNEKKGPYMVFTFYGR